MNAKRNAIVRIEQENQSKPVRITGENKPRISNEIMDKWQEMVDLLADIMGVPSALIMKIHPRSIEVFLHNEGEKNPYERNEKAELGLGLYCETVIGTNRKLEVPNALGSATWDHNPDIALNMIYYLGLPLRWPDQEIFGTICVLDSMERSFSETYQQMLKIIRDTIERDMSILVQTQSLEQSLRDLEETQSQYVEAEKAATLNSLISGLSEEVNTPLEACLDNIDELKQVVGDLEEVIAKNELSSERLEAYRNNLKRSVDIMSSSLLKSIEIMEEMKNVTEGVGAYAVTEFNLKKQLDSVVATHSQQFRSKQIDVDIDCSESLRVKSYETIYSQLILHLLLNSVEHGFADRDHGRIHINVRADDHRVTLDYRDNGVGIHRDHMGHLFEPFFTTQGNDKKAGLGLYIVKHLVTAYLKGTIEAIQNANGAHFKVVVPLIE